MANSEIHGSVVEGSLRRDAGVAMHKNVAYRFFAVPSHHVADYPGIITSDELFEPDLPFVFDAIERALSGAEYRDLRARDHLRAQLSTDLGHKHASPGKGFGPSAVFANPPNDLPALLRLAEQLDTLAQAEAGERALVWKCGECQTRYAVPVALVRRVSIRCERCSAAVDLVPEKSAGEESLLDPNRGAVNEVRRQLAAFFREAMARGWPVLVATNE